MPKSKPVPKKDTSPKVYQREKIAFDLHIRELPWTEKQKAMIALGASRESRILFVSGPAGSSKTTTAMRIALQLLNEKKVSDIVCIRAAVESSDSKLGYLPGDITDKYSPYMGPFEDKLEELLPEAEAKKLKLDNRIDYKPINFCRGASWTARCVIIDEAQNLTINELQTLMTRVGQFTKMIVCADSKQSDLPRSKQGAFDKCSKMFDTDKAREFGIYSLAFTNEDIVRSELCKFIVETFETNHDQLHSEHKETKATSTQSSVVQVPLVWRPGE